MTRVAIYLAAIAILIALAVAAYITLGFVRIVESL